MRNVVVGGSSRVWKTLSSRPALNRWIAIGHVDLPRFGFTPLDRVWVLSYSRDPRDNSEMLARLGSAGVREIVYVSSSSAIVARSTDCYTYPRAKLRAEVRALELPNAKVLTIGLMHEKVGELPAGSSVGTSFDELADFMAAPAWPDDGGRRKLLLRVITNPFAGGFERAVFRLYGALVSAAGGHPCLLRPVDALLRLMGMRWYGYTFLSNRLWISTIS